MMASFKYSAVYTKQRDSAQTVFALICAPAAQILKWARIDRLEPNNLKGVQRKKNDSKVRSIRQYYHSDPRNTIPTAITIALPYSAVAAVKFPPDSAGLVHHGEIEIKFNEGDPLPGLIIDGQHRIFGINEFSENMPVNVVLIVGADDAEIAFQFLVINNKVSKVSPDHIRALQLGYSAEELDARLAKSARMKSSGSPTYLETIDTDPASPFNNRIRWPRHKDDDVGRLVPPNAFEICLAYIDKKQITSHTDTLSPNADYLVDFFLEMWKEVRDQWPSAWQSPNAKLISKVGIVCMNQYLVDGIIQIAVAMDTLQNLDDLSKVREYCGLMLRRQEYEFWEAAWETSSLDTGPGRDLVMEDLRRIEINKAAKRSWSNGLKLVTALQS